MTKGEVLVLLGDPRLPDIVKRGGRFNAEDHEVVTCLREALATLNEFSFSYVDDHTLFVKTLTERRPRLVLNLCDEGFRNNSAFELHVPALLELLGLPYTGSGPACLALCARKHDVRAVALTLGIPVPDELHVRAAFEKAPTLRFPLFVKPVATDGSFGITRASIVNNIDELNAQLASIPHAESDGVLVQEWLEGTEYSVTLLDQHGTVSALPVLEVDYQSLPISCPRMLPDEAKWDPESPYWKNVRYVPARVDPRKQDELVQSSRLLFERFGCRDYARFDFREDAQRQPRLIDVNPNPGWCSDGKLNLMAEWAGLSYPALLSTIIDAGLRRATTR